MRTTTDRVEWVKSNLERFEGPLIRYACRITGNVDQARDVVQDTFLALCAAERSRVEGHEAAWLYTVCRNRALDLQRKERRMISLSETRAEAQAALEPPPSALAEREDTQSHIMKAVGTLPKNQQDVIRLKFQDAMSYKDISQVTGLSVSNVGYLIHTAIKTVRLQLAAHTDLMDEA